MDTRKLNPIAHRLERIIRQAIDTRSTLTLRCLACLAHDHALALVLVRAEAAERFVGGRHG